MEWQAQRPTPANRPSASDSSCQLLTIVFVDGFSCGPSSTAAWSRPWQTNGGDRGAWRAPVAGERSAPAAARQAGTLDIVNRTANLVSRLRVPARGARGEIAKETTKALTKRTIRRPVRFFLPGTPHPYDCQATLHHPPSGRP